MPGDKPLEISAIKRSSLATLSDDPIRISEQPSPDEKLLSLYLNDRQFAPWKQVVEVFRRAIASAVIKTLRRFRQVEKEQVDELIQECYVRLCGDNYRIFRECRAERPAQLFGLVQTVAMTTTIDWYRSRNTESRGGAVSTVSFDGMPASTHPSSNAHKNFQRDLLILDIERHLESLCTASASRLTAERDRRIFRLYYFRGYTAPEIAAIADFQLSEKGVESLIHRMTSELRRVFSENVPDQKGAQS